MCACACLRVCVYLCEFRRSCLHLQMYETSFLRRNKQLLSVFSRNRPDNRATRRLVPPPLAYRSSHFLLAAPSSQTLLSAPPVHRQDSCCHPIPLLRPFLCSDDLNQTSDGIRSSIHHHHHLLQLCQQIVYRYSNSNSPVCMLFERVHLYSLLGPSVHHQWRILQVGGV